MEIDNTEQNNSMAGAAENAAYSAAAAAGESAGTVCWSCKKAIDPQDAYCRHCGKGQGTRLPFAYTPFGLFTMFLCIGPFAIYFVARSPAMSRRAKIIFSSVMTLLFCYMCYSGFVKFMERMNEIQQIFGTGAMPVF